MFPLIACHSIQRAQSRFCERRKSLRWELHIPVTLFSTYRAEGTICNLSTGGCAVRAMSSYHHSEEILLAFVLPGAGQVAIRAAVRWISRPFVGVEFLRDQDQAKLAVGSYLDQLMQRKLAKGIAIY